LPAQESYTVTVTPQNITTLTIPYSMDGGPTRFFVRIAGLPNNLSAQVKVTGPYGYNSSLSISGGTSQPIGLIVPGNYILQPQLAGAPSVGFFPAWFPNQLSYTVTVPTSTINYPLFLSHLIKP